MAGVSLKCGDCGALLKSVEEAQEHAELAKHADFSESTEAVLNLVCSTCGKPCRSETTTKLISLEASKNQSSNDVDMPDASTAGEPEAFRVFKLKPVVEMVVLDVDSKLLAELESMGFSKKRATPTLHFSGNSSLEAPANWIVEHEDDADIDQMPLVFSPSSQFMEFRRCGAHQQC